MGRSIPSFRQLIEIERLDWSYFKNKLSKKEYKQSFDLIFYNAKLYSGYLSNANNPIPWQSIVMGALFHNYKTLLRLKDEDLETEYLLKEKINRLEKENPKGKILFDKICEKWDGLLYALHNRDEISLRRMLIECCYGLNEETIEQIINEDSKYSRSSSLFLYLILQNQKILEDIKNSKEKIGKTDVTLLDFMP